MLEKSGCLGFFCPSFGPGFPGITLNTFNTFYFLILSFAKELDKDLSEIVEDILNAHDTTKVRICCTCRYLFNRNLRIGSCRVYDVLLPHVFFVRSGLNP